MNKLTIEQKIIRKRTITEDGCWVNVGTSREHYSYTTHDNKKVGRHRLAYEFYVGSIPNGLVINHLCRNKSCYNPLHLEAVTQSQNTRYELLDGGSLNRSECRSGHPFIGNRVFINTKKGTIGICDTCRKNYKQTLRNS